MTDKVLPVDAWMPFFVGDWLTGAATFPMSNQQRGAFVQLLSHAWKQHASLPDDMKMLAKYADEPREWLDTPDGAAVLAQFPVGADGRRRNPKQAEVYLKAVEARQEKHDRAQRAARSRWGSGGGSHGEPTQSSGNAPALQQECPPSSLPSKTTAADSASVLAAALESRQPAVAWVGDNEHRRATVASAAQRVFAINGDRGVLGFVSTLSALIQEYKAEVIERGLTDWLAQADALTGNSLRIYVASANRNARNVSSIETATTTRKTPSRRAENATPSAPSKLLDA